LRRASGHAQHATRRRRADRRREQIDAAFADMRTDPYGGDIRFLKRTDRVLRRRVGDWRILYEVYADRGILFVNDVERRDSNTY
jgi:mRNA-degrading endonuclease RelE of RelBE toxin-antitoxin system